MSETQATVLLFEHEMRLREAQVDSLARESLAIKRVVTMVDTLHMIETSPTPNVVIICARSIPFALATLAGPCAQAGIPVLVVALRPTMRGATFALRLGAGDYLGLRDPAAHLAAAIRRLVQRDMAHESLSEASDHQADVETLRSQMRDKDDFLSLVSHELRTPLMTINGYLELLQKHHETLPASKTRDYLSRSLQATGELASLSDLLIQALRLEDGEAALDLGAVALDTVVPIAIEQCDLIASGHIISVEVTQGLHVHAEFLALQQVLRNLISNAIKYSPEGGHIWVTAAPSAGDTIMISIRDEGIGIAPERIPELFGRFARVHDRERWPAIRGTGLGLYICRQLVTGMGGNIWAESVPEHGSTFHVCLPMAEAAYHLMAPFRRTSIA